MFLYTAQLLFNENIIYTYITRDQPKYLEIFK